MSTFLSLAFLFFVGSVAGWVIELVFRRFFSSENPEHRWINPGFCTGPYLPLYGFGLCTLYYAAQLERSIFTSSTLLARAAVLVVMGLSMTLLEYIAGILCLRVAKVRLWDYSNEWGNIRGIICPRFSLFWTVLGALYYFLIHPYIMGALDWLSRNLAFSFVVGMFFGLLAVDVAHSAQLVSKLKRYADENDVIVRYEAIKSNIRKKYTTAKTKYHFFRPFRTEQPLSEHLRELKDSFETIKKKLR